MKLSKIMIACTAVAAMAGAAIAQQQQQQQQQQRPGAQDRATQQQPTQMQRPMMDQQMRQQFAQMQMLHHVEDVHGLNVTNYDRENLGNVETLIVDTQGERVVFAVVSIGGFLGIGDTLIAVPWEAFELRPMYEGLVLNMTRSQLEAAPQFEGDRWPNFGDQQWNQRIHQYYGTTPHHERQQPGMRDRPGREHAPGRQQAPGQQRAPGQQQAPGQQPGAQQPGAQQPGMGTFVRTDELTGTNVEDGRGETLGTLNDIAFEIFEGTVAYAVVGTGGFLGMWQSDVAVPWQALQIQVVDRDDYQITTDLTQERLERAPEYDRDAWPTQRHVEWAQQWYPTQQPGARPGERRDRDWDRERDRDRDRPGAGAQQIQQQLQQAFTRAGMQQQQAQQQAQQLAQRIQQEQPDQRELQQMIQQAMTQAGVDQQTAQQEAQQLAPQIQRMIDQQRN